jgi:hypothetical protein
MGEGGNTGNTASIADEPSTIWFTVVHQRRILNHLVVIPPVRPEQQIGPIGETRVTPGPFD